MKVKIKKCVQKDTKNAEKNIIIKKQDSDIEIDALILQVIFNLILGLIAGVAWLIGFIVLLTINERCPQYLYLTISFLVSILIIAISFYLIKKKKVKKPNDKFFALIYWCPIGTVIILAIIKSICEGNFNALHIFSLNICCFIAMLIPVVCVNWYRSVLKKIKNKKIYSYISITLLSASTS